MKWSILGPPTDTYMTLHQRIAERSILNLSVGKHLFNTNKISKAVLLNNFLVLKKCRSKFDCVILEMLIIQDLNPTLNNKPSKRANWSYKTTKVNVYYTSSTDLYSHSDKTVKLILTMISATSKRHTTIILLLSFSANR